MKQIRKTESFEDLLVWQKAMNLVGKIYGACRNQPLSRDWGLRDQLQRTAVSIPANIAEGYERGSHKGYLQFLAIAKGSAGELRCLIQVCERVRYLERNPAEELTSETTEISKMIMGLMSSLKRANNGTLTLAL